MRHVIRASALAAVCCLSLAACSDSDDRSNPQPSPRTTLKLGQSADTASADDKGTVRITPDTVVYVDKTRTDTPEHDLFAVVTFTAENRAKTPRSVTTSTDNGGFRWETPDGHTIKAGNGKGAAKIAPIGFSDGGTTVRPETHQVNTTAFDITTAEKGGTLVYVDGNGVSFRWQIPSTSSGPKVPALKFALQ